MFKAILSVAAAIFLSGCVAAPHHDAKTGQAISPVGATHATTQGAGGMPGMHGMTGGHAAGDGMMMCGKPGAAGGCGMMGHGGSAGSAAAGGCSCCAAMMKPRG